MRILFLCCLWLSLAACSTTPEIIPARSNGPVNIAVFTDGTNNDRKTNTNVRRLFDIIKSENRDDVSLYYDKGVGASITKITGNAFGVGMSRNIRQAYTHIARTYKNDKDKVFLFGFSRGAFTARALSGFIYTCGLLDINAPQFKDKSWASDLPIDEQRKAKPRFNDAKFTNAIHELYRIYRWKGKKYANFKQELAAFKKKYPTKNIKIEVVGVWDTVEAVGIDDAIDGMKKKPTCEKRHHRVYKVGAHSNIKNIYHAVSVDEQREIFWPILFKHKCGKKQPIPRATHVTEIWFPGVHSDVGGGYQDTKALGGISLNWMIGKLRKHGLVKSPDVKVNEAVNGKMHASWAGTLYRKVSRRVREIPAGSTIHQSVLDRMNASIPEPNEYREPNGRYLPAQAEFQNPSLLKTRYQIYQ